jgi:hypothetical protein
MAQVLVQAEKTARRRCPKGSGPFGRGYRVFQRQEPRPDVWYYADKTGQVGPVTLQELKERLHTYPNASDILVWRDGFTGWKPAKDVEELNEQTRLPPTLPSSETMYGELEVTWQRVARIWWLIVWRAMLGGLLIGVILGFIIGFIEGLIGLSLQTISISGAVAGWLGGLPWGLVVVRMALRKRYNDFRLALAPNISN